jgi:hypothetical protein
VVHVLSMPARMCLKIDFDSPIKCEGLPGRGVAIAGRRVAV